MSLVGPAPLPVKYLDATHPEQARRHEVRPGITGLAQVNGRNTLGWDDRFALDVWYVDHRSCWLDLRILAAHPGGLARRRGHQRPGPGDDGRAATAGSRHEPGPASHFRRAGAGPNLPVPARRAGAERASLLAAVESGWVAPVGPDLDAFEDELAERCGVPHAVALSAGTAALHLALLQVGCGPATTCSCRPSPSPPRPTPSPTAAPDPVFIDSDPTTWNSTPPARRRARRAPRPPGPAARAPSSPSTCTAQCADYDAHPGRSATATACR